MINYFLYRLVAGSCLLAISCLCFGIFPATAQHTPGVPSIEQPERYLSLLKGKRLAIVANQSSVIGGERSIDVLLRYQLNIVRAFGPEHGLTGAYSANTPVSHDTDPATGIPVVSLFGKYQKPSPKDLEGIDLVLFDMQDVGVRFYTYISTLHYVMEACAEKGIPVIVFDRPNPNDGYVDGPVRQPGYESFISMHPVPVVHGLTIGEYAQMINGERWLSHHKRCQLKVIPMEQYRHGDSYRFTIAPSPNLNTLRSIYLYPSLCWFGATAVSDARGTLFPFQALGSPSLKGSFDFAFVPLPIRGMNESPRYKGDSCYGLDLRNEPVAVFGAGGRLNLQWLLQLYKAYPDKASFFNGEKEAADPVKAVLHFDQLAGNGTLRQQIHAGLDEAAIRASWSSGLQAYKKIRARYLLYPDAPATLKVITYNIHHGADKDEKDQLAEMAGFIADNDPDIVVLQEVDSVCNRSHNRDQPAILAKKAGLHYVFARHFAFENGGYGNAMLSKYPIENIRDHRLPIDASANHNAVAFLTADIRTPQKGLVRVAVVHMDYRSETSRVKQAGIIKDVLQSSTLPVILAGDMNASPSAPPAILLSKAFTDASDTSLLSFPADRPDRKIDYIFVGKGWKPVWSKTFPVLFSDHLPLMVVVE